MEARYSHSGILLREKANGPCRTVDFKRLDSKQDALHSSFRAVEFWGEISGDDPWIVEWIQILQQEEKEWECISFKTTRRSRNPANDTFGTLLTACSSRTENLVFMETMVGEQAYHCLQNCLQHPLTKVKGVGFFQNHESPYSHHDAQAFCRCLANATCLERIHLGDHNFMELETANLIVQGLSQSSSLKEVVIFSSQFHPSTVPHLISALEPAVEHFEYSTPIDFQENVFFDHPVDPEQDEAFTQSLLNWITKPNCKLKRLRWKGAHSFGVEPIIGKGPPNTSVTKLQMPDSRITSQRLIRFLPIFESLVYLDLYKNKISNLTPLVNLLLNSRLEHLGLSLNKIDNVQVLQRNLSKIKVLKSLDLSQNPFLDDSNSVMSFVNSLSENQSIERCQLFSHSTIRSVSKEALRYFGRTPNYNRGFRRALSSSDVPSPSLWSRVLARAFKLDYYQKTDQMGEPTDTSYETKADVVHALLQAHLTDILLR